jgi:CHAT domain-containing protein
MQPVRARIGAARRVFISTDGSLNLIPFAALVDERDRELVKDYLFVYLTSGRDLLRLQIKQSGNDDSFIFAGPSFDATREDLLAAARLEDRTRDIVKQKGDGNGPGQIVQSPRLDQISFTPLPGATEEAGALRKLLPEARMFTGLQALESELKLVSRPRLLHIATHGFFLKDPGSTSPSAGARTDKASPAAQSFEARVIENPLLRSGLALAGANNRKSVVDGTDDGILTAMEAAGLDLWGTKLVVLSACDTGVGEVRNGDGVYGLRRAFVLAGSETQVMSLWSVSDQGTKELMVDYYKRLLRGEGRGEALRRVQLRMLKNPKRRHPFYWASFIQSGEWANLDGKR